MYLSSSDYLHFHHHHHHHHHPHLHHDNHHQYQGGGGVPRLLAEPALWHLHPLRRLWKLSCVSCNFNRKVKEGMKKLTFNGETDLKGGWVWVGEIGQNNKRCLQTGEH